MSHARVIVAQQETWYRGVVAANSDGRYLHLELDAHPSHICIYLAGPPYADVLLCVDGTEVTAALREEKNA